MAPRKKVSNPFAPFKSRVVGCLKCGRTLQVVRKGTEPFHGECSCTGKTRMFRNEQAFWAWLRRHHPQYRE